MFVGGGGSRIVVQGQFSDFFGCFSSSRQVTRSSVLGGLFSLTVVPALLISI